MLLECSEDVPFSPLRQSYTPLPMNQSNANDSDDHTNVSTNCNSSCQIYSNDSENELHIIDIKLQDQDDVLDTNDDEPADDNVNMSIGKEDVVLFTINAANDGNCSKSFISIIM